MTTKFFYGYQQELKKEGPPGPSAAAVSVI
jgi:hypothetical protein